MTPTGARLVLVWSCNKPNQKVGLVTQASARAVGRHFMWPPVVQPNASWHETWTLNAVPSATWSPL